MTWECGSAYAGRRKGGRMSALLKYVKHTIFLTTALALALYAGLLSLECVRMRNGDSIAPVPAKPKAAVVPVDPARGVAEGPETGQSVQESVIDDAGMAAWRRGVEAALKNARDPAPASAPASASALRPAESGSVDQAATNEQAEDAPKEQPDATPRPRGEDAANPRAEKTIDRHANRPVIDRPGQGGEDGSVWGNGPVGVIPFVKPEGPPFGQMRTPVVPRHFWEGRRFSFWRGAHRVEGIARSGW